MQSGSFLTNENTNNSIIVSLNLNGGVWKLVQSLSVPNKVKNFLWRSSGDVIPVKVNLKKQKILLSDTCDHCNRALESVLHALWDCPEIS